MQTILIDGYVCFCAVFNWGCLNYDFSVGNFVPVNRNNVATIIEMKVSDENEY